MNKKPANSCDYCWQSLNSPFRTGNFCSEDHKRQMQKRVF